MQADTYSAFKTCGADVRISPTAHFSRPEKVSIGDHVSIDEFFACAVGLDLGSYIHISKHVGVIGGNDGLLRMGNFTNISLGGRIVCASDEFGGEGLIGAGIPKEYCDRVVVAPVVFEDFANTGASVTILPGVKLPQGVVIGACSLVRASDALKPWTIYAGNPLREIKPRRREKMLEFARALGFSYDPVYRFGNDA